MGLKSTDWLENQLKAGDIRIQSAFWKSDKAPVLEGVLRTADGVIHQISLWPVKTKSTAGGVYQGRFEDKEQAKINVKAKLQRKNKGGNLDLYIPD